MIRRTRHTVPAEPTPAPVAVAWPEGVIARYLTAAGAALANPDITVDVIDRGPERHTRYAHTCRGCTGHSDATVEWHIREKAEQHAETCRALPHPSGH